MTTFNFKQVVSAISSSPLYQKMLGVPRGVSVEALVIRLMREIKGEAVRYIPARKVVVFAIPQGTIWFDEQGRMFYHNGFTVRTDFTTKSATEVLGEVFDLLKKLSEETPSRPTPVHATTVPPMQTAVQGMVGSLSQVQEAMMVEFREKLARYAIGIDQSELPKLTQEIMALQQRLVQVKQLQQQTDMLLGQQSPYYKQSPFEQPIRTGWGVALSLKQTVRTALGNTLMVIDQLPQSELERVAQVAIAYIRQHRADLACYIPMFYNHTELVYFIKRVANEDL